MSTMAMNKRPLVLVSGMLCDDAVWSKIVPALSDVAECIPVELGRMESAGEVAERILTEAPGRFALAGHSLGGRVVLEVMRRVPQRVALLGLIGTAYRGLPAGDAGTQESAMRQKMIDAAEAEGLRAYAWRWVKRMVHPERLPERKLIDPIVDMVERVGIEGLRAQVKLVLSRPDATDILATIPVPTMVLCARQDMAMPVSVHEEMAKTIPNTTLTIIENSGHMMMLERPESTVGAIVAWLARWEGESHQDAQEVTESR